MFVYEKDGKLNIAFQNTQIPPETADVVLSRDATTGTITAAIGDNEITGESTKYTVTIDAYEGTDVTFTVNDEEFTGGEVIRGTEITVDAGSQEDEIAVDPATAYADDTITVTSDTTVTVTAKGE